MAASRSAPIRNLLTLLQSLNQPRTWGAGLAFLLSLWVLIDDVPSPDSPNSPSVKAPNTVSTALESNAAEEPVNDGSVNDLNELLKDPTLAKYGVNETDETVQLDLLNRLLTSPFATPITTVTSPNSADRSTTQSNAIAEESPEAESAASTRSSLLQSSSHSRPITHPGLYHRGQTAIRPIAGQKSTIDRQSSLQTAKPKNLWQVDFSTSSTTPDAPAGSVPQPTSLSSDPTQAATALNSTTDRTPPALRIPATSRRSFSPSSTFITPQSSQIIQTFQPPLDATAGNSTAMPQDAAR